MILRALTSVALLACLMVPAAQVWGDAQWVGGGGDDLWNNAANWDPAVVPASATERSDPPGPPHNDANVARFPNDGTTTVIEAGIDAVAFAVQLGHPKGGAFGNQSASNTLNMTGGTLTTQGNFLFNVGRGTNVDPNHLAQFNVSGGVVNAAGITVPEAFSPGLGSVGINAEMHVSGDAIVNTDLLRLGSNDANSLITVSDNAQINLTDDNNGFANGQLWLESFEDLDDTGGTSVLDIRDNGVVRIHGGVNNIQDDQAASAGIIINELIPRGMILANGGSGPNGTVGVSLDGGVITLRAVPEPATAALALLFSAAMVLLRRRS